MNTNVGISGARIGFTVAAALVEILLPLVLGLVARRRLGVSWRYFGYGALIFLIFQLLTRVPLVQIIQGQIGPRLQADRALLLGWLAILSLTAGLFEEIGRYVGYRWLMRRDEKTWAKAVMYGLGHGGLESMLLVAGLTLIGLINLLVLSQTDLSTLPLTPEQRAQVEQQLAAAAAQPVWLPLLGVWERVWSIVFHVAQSVLVLQVFRRNSMSWLWIAIATHTALNLVATSLPIVLGLQGTAALLLPEAIVTVAGLIGLWAIWALRDRPEAAGAFATTTAPGGPPLAAEANPPEADETQS
jgi:uncharacterized membrane protein YhfC